MGGLRRELPVVFWTFTIGAAVACGAAARHRRLLQQGPHHRHEPRLGGRQRLVLGRLAGRRASSPRCTRSAWCSSCSSASATPRSRGGRAGGSCCRSYVLGGALDRRRLRLDAGVAGRLPPARGLPATRRCRSSSWTGAVRALRRRAPARRSLTILVVVVGIGLAWLLWMPWRQGTRAFAASPAIRPLAAFWLGGWGFDWLYERVFVRPVKWFARVARNDLVDYVVGGIAWLNVAAWRAPERRPDRTAARLRGRRRVRHRPRPRRRGAEVTP